MSETRTLGTAVVTGASSGIGKFMQRSSQNEDST